MSDRSDISAICFSAGAMSIVFSTEGTVWCPKRGEMMTIPVDSVDIELASSAGVTLRQDNKDKLLYLPGECLPILEVSHL